MLIGFNTALTATLSAVATEIKIPPAFVARLNALTIGDVEYFSITTEPAIAEAVQYVHAGPLATSAPVPVVRAALGTVAAAFPTGSCVEAIENEAAPVVEDPECECTPLVLVCPSEPAGGVLGKPYQLVLTFTGSQQGVEFCGDGLPACFKATIVGNTVSITGVPQSLPLTFPISLRNACECDCSTCVITIPDATPPTACDITVTVLNATITTPGQLRSYTISSGTGCTTALVKIVGTIGGVPYNTATTVALPYSFADTGAGSMPGDIADVTLTVEGQGACVNSLVCGSPARLISNVPLTGGGCGFNFNANPQNITTAGVGRIFTVSGTPGAGFTLTGLGTCSNTNGGSATVVNHNIAGTIPLSGTYIYIEPVSVVGQNCTVTWTVVAGPGSANPNVCGSPITTTTVVGEVSGQCGGIMTLAAAAVGCSGPIACVATVSSTMATNLGVVVATGGSTHTYTNATADTVPFKLQLLIGGGGFNAGSTFQFITYTGANGTGSVVFTHGPFFLPSPHADAGYTGILEYSVGPGVNAIPALGSGVWTVNNPGCAPYVITANDT